MKVHVFPAKSHIPPQHPNKHKKRFHIDFISYLSSQTVGKLSEKTLTEEKIYVTIEHGDSIRNTVFLKQQRKGFGTYDLGTHKISDIWYCGGHYRMASHQQHWSLDSAG